MSMSLALALLPAALGPLLAQTPASSVYQGIQIDAPVDGRIRIENQFGEIKVEVWKEKFVSVYAIVDPSASFARSPVVIENKPRLLAITIVRRRSDPAAQIELAVKVPMASNLDVITGKHAVSMQGLPLSATLTSLSGSVGVELPAPINVDIRAKSTSGSINSTLAQLLTSGSNALQSRIGTGAQKLAIDTQSGNITLTEARPVISGQDSRGSR